MTKFLTLTAIAAIGLTACSGGETPAEDMNGVTVTVTNVQDSGKIYVALQEESIFGSASATYGATVDSAKVANNTVDVFIPNVDAGMYAVAVFQDVNGDGDMDIGDNGIPSEPWALSNGAGTQGAPTFADAGIDMVGDGDTVSIRLVN